MGQDSDESKLQISGLMYKQNVYLIGAHLRDARNILDFLNQNPEIGRADLLANAVILFASAGLESNLSYFSALALVISNAAPQPIFKEPESDYLKAVQQEYSRNAELVVKKQKQGLADRLQIVPKLLGRAIDREFRINQEDARFSRLDEAIKRRDAVVHPRWNAYPHFGRSEAVDALSGVLQYIDSVCEQLAPYMIGYSVMLGYHASLLGEPPSVPSPLKVRVLNAPRDLIGALVSSWGDAHIMYGAALTHPTEGNSAGSMLTRAALVSLYSMVAAHLSISARLAQLTETGFTEKDINYFNEQEFELDNAGNTVLCDSKQRFEERATIVPMLISKKACPREIVFDCRGETWYQNMFKKYFEMRNAVMHSSLGEVTPCVSKLELKEAFESVHRYFEFLSRAGGTMDVYRTLLGRDKP